MTQEDIEESNIEIITDDVADTEENFDENFSDVADVSEDDGKYPLPMATVVRLMKKNMPDKMISSKVKIAMNLFLGEMIKKVSEEMATSRYSMIEMDDFQRATDKFLKAEDLDAEKDRIVSHLIGIRGDVESMVRELERKFSIETI
ncbi:MAG: NFYB/HAP3 family transcription factor subunit [DPANN group archaeon]|nr:NFYB/HAP3 family transcription factor subunit [DPANN group archaeon]